VLVMAAAVGDYRPSIQHESKVKRGRDPIAIDLVPNPDILSEIGHARTGPHPVLVGFALETDEGDALIERARGKLRSKLVDIVVGNVASTGFGGDTNEAILCDHREVEHVPPMSKDALADRILNRVVSDLSKRGT